MAAVAVTGVLMALSIGPSGQWQPQSAYSTDKAPKEDRGIRMDASIEGKEFITDGVFGSVVKVAKGETINVVTDLRNINNPSMEFAGYSQSLEVFNSDSESIVEIVASGNTELITLKPGEQIRTGNAWSGYMIEQLENGEYAYPQAPPGLYTVRATFVGGDFRLADEFQIVIGEVSQ